MKSSCWSRVGVVVSVGLWACAPKSPEGAVTGQGYPNTSNSSAVASPTALAATATVSSEATSPPLRSRSAFTLALSNVKPGMQAAEVMSLLGPPDDIRTQNDPGGISATRTVEVWRYGTSGHLTFATLGTVHIQADRTVQYVFGGAGTPPDGAVFDETELRRLLRLLDAVPSYDAPGDPRALIEVVNALQPLGKARAVAAMQEYLRVASSLDDPGREGTFLVARTLFDVPKDPGYFRSMAVGAPTLAPPKDPRSLPRFPIVIVDDIPFNVVSGYMLAGQAEPPESHLAWCRDHAELRAQPLMPPATPLDTLEQMIGSPSTAFLLQTGLDGEGRRLIFHQGARLLSTALSGGLHDDMDADTAFHTYANEHHAAHVQWNAAKSHYELFSP